MPSFTRLCDGFAAAVSWATAPMARVAPAQAAPAKKERRFIIAVSAGVLMEKITRLARLVEIAAAPSRNNSE